MKTSEIFWNLVFFHFAFLVFILIFIFPMISIPNMPNLPNFNLNISIIFFEIITFLCSFTVLYDKNNSYIKSFLLSIIALIVLGALTFIMFFVSLYLLWGIHVAFYGH